ncbi:MAG: hypothetical protein AAGD10_09780 [Myxococcota bacterium]
MRALIAVLLILAVVLAYAEPSATAFEIERNFAGSIQLDYLAIPSNERGRDIALDGFTTELALKLAVDFGERTSANVKVCYGCHGFEVAMAYLDLRVVDQLNFRVGRFTPRFGDFWLRHDPANHRANTKPLMYDMGRMLRRTEFNNSILPIPYADNGVEVYGTQWFGDDVQIDWAAHLVQGLRGPEGGFDVDFVLSRSPALYYIDNNSEPALGGRLALTINFTDFISATVGGSTIWGRWDPDRFNDYLILGTDLYLRVYALALRAEAVTRRTEFTIGPNPESRFRFEIDDDFFIKEGFYAELEYPFSRWLEAFFRLDGLRQRGNVLVTSPLSRDSAILRYTPGVNVVFHPSLRLKLSAEFWDFSDFQDEIALHAGMTANF